MVIKTGSRYDFELTGGHLALDLANTKERRPTPTPREHLSGYADLVNWAVQTRTLDERKAERLRSYAERHPLPARRALLRTVELREALFEAFSAVAAGRQLPGTALERINAALPSTLGRLRLALAGGGAAWAWASADKPYLDRPWWPALRAGAELLTSGDLSRLRECAAADCAWMFFDHSRNGTRRWCDMSVCGNREKARRFQRRARLARPATPTL